MKKRAVVFFLLLLFLFPAICLSKAPTLFTSEPKNPLFASNKFKIYGEVSGDEFTLRIQARTLGTIGIGMGDSADLGSGDMILAYVDSSGVHILDAYMNAYGYYLEDSAHGGKDDILEAVGYESFGNTVIEFKRKFTTNDVFRNDSNLTENEPISFLWVISDSDDFTSKALEGGYGVFSFNSPIINYEIYNSLYKILLILAVFLLLAAVLSVNTAIYEKRLKLHRILVLAGLISTLIGSLCLFLAKGDSFKMLNIILGSVFILLAVSTLIFGLMTVVFMRKNQKKEKSKVKIRTKTRSVHLTLGLLTLIFLITAVIIELVIFGLFF